jgi:hypothetical protein
LLHGATIAATALGSAAISSVGGHGLRLGDGCDLLHGATIAATALGSAAISSVGGHGLRLGDGCDLLHGATIAATALGSAAISSVGGRGLRLDNGRGIADIMTAVEGPMRLLWRRLVLGCLLVLVRRVIGMPPVPVVTGLSQSRYRQKNKCRYGHQKRAHGNFPENKHCNNPQRRLGFHLFPSNLMVRA